MVTALPANECSSTVCDAPSHLSLRIAFGYELDRTDLIDRNLLYGAVTCAAGRLGDEPVRPQGHAHAVSSWCSASTADLYEIWAGTPIILVPESDGDDPGHCFAVQAEPGELVVVPPGWAHTTIIVDSTGNCVTARQFRKRRPVSDGPRGSGATRREMTDVRGPGRTRSWRPWSPGR